MNYGVIEQEVKKLHEEIWKYQDDLWPNRHVTPFEMLSPEVAAHILGLEYLELENLGHGAFSYKGQKFKVAGLLDRQAKKIAVSREFSLQVMRFTALHEVGHWLLHPDEVMHRDRPLSSANKYDVARPAIEKEADHFAACFLMPQNLLRKQFQKTFGVQKQFLFNDTTAFHLRPDDPESLMLASKDSLERELALASCKRFNGHSIVSLADQFSVSNQAMAIRIKELELVRWP